MEREADTITWIGHAGFKFVFYDNKNTKRVVYIDPWFSGPKCPETEKEPEETDLVLITHGHFDHSIGAPVILSKYPKSKVISNYEIGEWLKISHKIPPEQVIQGNKGGTFDLGFCSVTIVGADHSSSCPGHNGEFLIGGNPAGFILRFNERVFYHAGDTNVFLDMSLIAELYKPQVALLPIGGVYTMAPYEAAYASLILLQGIKVVIPMHFGTFPALAGNVPDLINEVQKLSQERSVNQNFEIIDPEEIFGKPKLISELI